MTREDFYALDKDAVVEVTLQSQRVLVIVMERPQFPDGDASDRAYGEVLLPDGRPLRFKLDRETTVRAPVPY